jgi:uncharacterized membrane protein
MQVVSASDSTIHVANLRRATVRLIIIIIIIIIISKLIVRHHHQHRICKVQSQFSMTMTTKLQEAAATLEMYPD